VDGQVVAVIQAINKVTDEGKMVAFDADDEVLIIPPSIQIGIAISNRMMVEVQRRQHSQVKSLLKIVRSLHSDMGLSSLMFTRTERSPSGIHRPHRI